MFWGVTLESGKRYTQVVDSSFHVSMATLEPLQKEPSDKYVKLMIEHRNAEFLLCVLQYNDVLQVALDLNFVEGEEISFYLNGAEGTVHLSGYLSEFDHLQGLDDAGDADEEEVSDEASEDEAVQKNHRLQQRKKKVKAKQKPTKKASIFDNEAEESSDDDDEAMEDEWGSASDEESDIGSEQGQEEEDSEEEEVPRLVGQKRKRAEAASGPTKNHVQKQGKRTLDKAKQKKDVSLSSVSTQEMSPEGKTEGMTKRKRKNKKRRTQEDSMAGKDSTTPPKAQGALLPGGVRCQDLIIGSGPIAKRGKKVHVYYSGRLPNHNNRLFDSCQSGKPFSFVLGRGTVIKGWETGLEGMKVGGKRRLVIPPSQGYASNRVGDIPPNSTLTFDVELKAVS